MKSKYIYSADAKSLHVNNNFKIALPWSQIASSSATLQLEDCTFTGRFKPVLLDSFIEVHGHFKNSTIYYPQLKLDSAQEFVNALNEKLSEYNVSFSLNSSSKKIAIVFSQLLHPTLKLSKGLASVLGMESVINQYSEGLIDLGRAYDRLLLVCPQTEGNTFINGNLSSVLGILKPQKLTNGLVRYKLIRNLNAPLIIAQSFNYISLQLVPAVCPALPIPFEANGEILIKYSPNSQ